MLCLKWKIEENDVGSVVIRKCEFEQEERINSLQRNCVIKNYYVLKPYFNVNLEREKNSY